MIKTEYLAFLEKQCDKEATYFYEIKAENGPPIALIGFDNYPRNGDYTYFSYGLHRVENSEWKIYKPEYYITINNANRSFAAFFGFVISSFAWEKVMGWNTLIGAGDEDAVDGYPYRRIALGPPMYLGWENYSVQDGEMPIQFGLGYYISDEDFENAVKSGFGYLEERSKIDYNYWRTLRRA